jgi:transcriptional regulator with XRE-family HTH domain
MNYAEKIKARRRESRVSQAEIAVALARTQTWVCSIERGVIRIDDATFKRVLLEIERIAERKGAIAKAQREATARVIRDFENPKNAAEIPA